MKNKVEKYYSKRNFCKVWAMKYGISESTIQNIINAYIWKHI
jgi:hypothetical protein